MSFPDAYSEEKYANESIQMLYDAGINFDKHRTSGIPLHAFAEYFMTSGK